MPAENVWLKPLPRQGGLRVDDSATARSNGGTMSERVNILSEGLKLAGELHVPRGLAAGERRPAFLVLHGFGGNKQGEQGVWATKTLLAWGYVCLQIDFRGCGESEGERGRIVPQEEVIDAQSAISFLETRAEVDPKRIAICGSSLGAAVGIVTAGVDPRVAALISQG